MNAPDITDGWTLRRDDDGTYSAFAPGQPDIPYASRFGNGRTELSAWVELYDLLCDIYEDDKRELSSS